MRGLKEPPVVRFLALVEKQPGNDGCWLWLGSINRKRGNYPYFNAGKGPNGKYRVMRAHVFSYTEFVGQVPAGKELDHTCRVRKCVRPDHLEPVTRRINLLRGDTSTAKNAAKTHCVNGHPFDDANTYRYKGRRDCVACRRIRQRVGV